MKQQSLPRTGAHKPAGLAPVLALALAGAMVLSACSTGPQPESVKTTLAQTTPARQRVARLALAQVGNAYHPHMAGPVRFDDSGLTYYAFHQNGRDLPRGRSAQLDAGQPIPLAKAEPGDLVFFRIDSPDGRGRLTVGLLIDTQVAVVAVPDAAAQGGAVRRIALNSRYWSQRLVGVSRILPETEPSS